VDVVIDVIHEEAAKDNHRLGGCCGRRDDLRSGREGRSAPAGLPARQTSDSSAGLDLVGLFEPSIQAVAVPAVFMPIMAGMGGNVGIQTFTER
jgi:magnesium transporter